MGATSKSPKKKITSPYILVIYPYDRCIEHLYILHNCCYINSSLHSIKNTCFQIHPIYKGSPREMNKIPKKYLSTKFLRKSSKYTLKIKEANYYLCLLIKRRFFLPRLRTRRHPVSTIFHTLKTNSRLSSTCLNFSATPIH